MLPQVHGSAHDVTAIVGGSPAVRARDLGDQAVGVQAPQAPADLGTCLLRIICARAQQLRGRVPCTDVPVGKSVQAVLADDSCFNGPIPRSRLVWAFGLSSARDAGDCGEGTNRTNCSRSMRPLPDAGYGVSGSGGLGRAGGLVAGCFSAFGEQIGWVLVRLGAPRRQARGCSGVGVEFFDGR